MFIFDTHFVWAGSVMSVLLQLAGLKGLKAIFDDYMGKPTWVSRHQNVSSLDFIGATMTEVVVTAGAIRHANLQSNRQITTKPTPEHFTGWMLFPLTNQSTVSQH